MDRVSEFEVIMERKYDGMKHSQKQPTFYHTLII